MKERIETITDFFIDFKGEEHYFVIAAVSKMLPTRTGQLDNNPMVDEYAPVYYEVNEYIDDGGGINGYLGVVSKALYLGVSICNPIDEFNEKVGIAKAIARAKNSDPSVFVTKPGLINTTMVKALLEQEAQYLKNNPGLFITGYEAARKKYMDQKEMESIEDNFSDIEKQVVEHTKNNPNFLDNILKYFGWKK